MQTLIAGAVTTGLMYVIRLCWQPEDDAKVQKAVAALGTAIGVVLATTLPAGYRNGEPLVWLDIIQQIVEVWIASMGVHSGVKRAGDIASAARGGPATL